MTQLNSMLESITAVDAAGDWATCYSPRGVIEITPEHETIIISCEKISFQVPKTHFETLIFPYSEEIRDYIARYAV